jgi:ligand-binding sensor domain-containing protein
MSKYGLSQRHTKFTSRDLLDFDYVDKLANHPDALAWLATFSAEYYQNTWSKAFAIQDTKEQRRQVYALDNARRRDVWTQRYRVPVDATDYMSYQEEKDGE